MQTDKKRLIKIILAFAAVYIIWGTTYLFIRLAIDTMPALFVAGSRFVIAGLFIYLFLRIRGAPPPKRSHWSAASIVGMLMLVGGSGMVHWVEQYIPTGITALVIATVPLFITFFDWLLYGNGWPGKKGIAGLLLGFVGIILLVGPDQISGTTNFSWTAMLILLLAPISWSLGSLQSREANLPDNSFMAAAMQMLTGGIVLLIAGLLTGEAANFDLATVSTVSWLSFLYLIFFGSIIAYTGYVYLLKMVSASQAATYSYVNPVIAVFLGWLILSEPVTPITITAMVVIVIAVFLITTSRPLQTVSEANITDSSGVDSLPYS